MNNLKPLTRDEMFLAKLGGQDVELPTPITRDEMFLADIVEAQNSGGGGSGSDIFSVAITRTYDSDTARSSFDSDKSFADIKQAYENGKYVVGRELFNEAGYFEGTTYRLTNIYEQDGSGYATFVAEIYDSGASSNHYDIMVYIVNVNSDGTVSGDEGRVESN